MNRIAGRTSGARSCTGGCGAGEDFYGAVRVSIKPAPCRTVENSQKKHDDPENPKDRGQITRPELLHRQEPGGRTFFLVHIPHDPVSLPGNLWHVICFPYCSIFRVNVRDADDSFFRDKRVTGFPFKNFI
jgi:hypothetical protein